MKRKQCGRGVGDTLLAELVAALAVTDFLVPARVQGKLAGVAVLHMAARLRPHEARLPELHEKLAKVARRPQKRLRNLRSVDAKRGARAIAFLGLGAGTNQFVFPDSGIEQPRTKCFESILLHFNPPFRKQVKGSIQLILYII